MIAEIKAGVLEAWQLMNASIKVYDENHNEIELVTEIDFNTGEIVRAVKDSNGNLIEEGDGIKEAKTIHNKFSIEYNAL